jgi:hypothetical protein
VADDKRFLLRLDPAVYRALRKWADDDLRSVNGQIEFLLRKALRDAGRTKDPGGGGGTVGSDRGA